MSKFLVGSLSLALALWLSIGFVVWRVYNDKYPLDNETKLPEKLAMVMLWPMTLILLLSFIAIETYDTIKFFREGDK